MGTKKSRNIYSQVRFNDGTIKCIFPDGEEESRLENGDIERVDKNGIKTVKHQNGSKDIIYPDGKIVTDSIN